MTTRAQIAEWFDRGKKDKKNPTHMIVVCDTFDHEDYPVYVYPDQDVSKRVKECDESSMQRVMEVYDLRKSGDEQLKSGSRVFNY